MAAKPKNPEARENDTLACRIVKNSMSSLAKMESIKGDSTAKTAVCLTLRQVLIQLDKESLVSSADFTECEELIKLYEEKLS